METAIALSVFLVSLGIIATEKINRSIIAILGAGVLLLTKVLNFEEAVEFVDFNVIGLLVGMMMIVSVLSKTGIFEYVAIKSVKLAKGRPVRLLFILSVITAVFSAFLDNVTTIVLIVPITLFIARILDVSPLPFVISEILFSNIGGAATIIGDPPNIIIASAGKIDFNTFLFHMGPFVIVMMAIGLGIIYLFFRKTLRKKIVKFKKIEQLNTDGVIKDPVLLKKSLFVLSLVLIGFFLHNLLHLEPSVIALAGAFLLLLITGHEVEEVYEKVEWQTIFFFIGLFIIVGGLEKVGILDIFAKWIKALVGNNELYTASFMLTFAGITSGFIDNIPITIVLVDLVKEMARIGMTIKTLWFALAIGADMGGNMTMIGASANVVGIDIYKRSMDKKKDDPISFMKFLKYGAPITIVSLILGLIYVYIRYFLLK